QSGGGAGMGRVIALLLIVLVVPVVAYTVAGGILGDYESEWQAALAKEYPYSSASARQALTLTKVCSDPKIRSEQICTDQYWVGQMRMASVLTAGLGLLLCGSIALAGRAGRNDREMLLKLFRPGLHFTMLGLIAIVVLQVALVVATLWFGESTATGYVHPWLIVGVGMTGAVGVLGLINGSLSVLRPSTTPLVAKTLSRAQASGLWALVEDVSHELTTDPPKTILVGLDGNFFVTEAGITCLDGQVAGRTLYLSLPLCWVLDVRELKAIIAHELAHFVGEDTQFSRSFYPIYRSAGESLAVLGANIEKNLRGFVLLPAALILSFFLDSFSVAEREISRDREMAADQVAVRTVDRATFAAALAKVQATSGVWSQVEETLRTQVEPGVPEVDIGGVYYSAAVAVLSDSSRSLGERAGQSMPHPTDSHPTLQARLSALGVELHDAASRILPPDVPAATLIPAWSDMMGALSHAWNVIVLQIKQAHLVGSPASKPSA
ncbi:MAG TPA: M48 family metalloprotease, partial [Thermomicrobiaceae bacterium]|nr:M48 family metalloprotease [Thermomicrobiaceae bacterium]